MKSDAESRNLNDFHKMQSQPWIFPTLSRRIKMNLEGRSCRVRGDKWTPVERKMKLPSCLAEVQKKRLIPSGSFLLSPEFFFFNDTAQTPPSCSLSLSDVPCFIDSPLVGAPSATSNSNYSHARQRKVVCWAFKWGIWSRVYLHHSFICIYRGNICWCLAYIAPLPCVWAFSDCKSPDTHWQMLSCSPSVRLFFLLWNRLQTVFH